jgi:hypothetical protein
MRKELTATSAIEKNYISYSLIVYDSNIVRGSLDVHSSNKYFIEQIESLLLKNEIEYYKKIIETKEEKVFYE